MYLMQLFSDFFGRIIAFLYEKLLIKFPAQTLSILFLFVSFISVSQHQISFPYTGKVQRWVVPSCTKRVKIEVWGAQGGGSMNCENGQMKLDADGGLGGYATGELNVVHGQLFFIVVGGQGKTGRNGYLDGGYNGGGDGGMYAAGGGGATDIRTILHDLDSRIIVGGGGGGGNTGCPNAGTGGNGGGTIGEDGIFLFDRSPAGGGGTQVFGGIKGNGPFSQDGTWGQGGNSGSGEEQFHMSGGGGGWFGGGSAYGAGGGGGSSNIWGVEDSSTLSGIKLGDGLVVITLLEDDQCTECEISCRSSVHISMPVEDCYFNVSPEQLLGGVTDQCTTFGFNLKITYPFGTDILTGQDVNRSHLNQPLLYSVSDLSGVSCYGYITVEDKAAPVTGCHGTRTVSCLQLTKLLDISTQVIDNCSEKNKAVIEKMEFIDFGCDDERGLGRITRTIRASDAWGNSSSCSDTLFISKDSIEEVNAPDLITLNCKVICRTANVTADNNLPDYEEITFSKDPKDKYYPTPELLLYLQAQDSFNSANPCLASYLNVVPYIYDSVLVWDEGEYIFEWQKVNLYNLPSPYCKLAVLYKDDLIPICSDGTGFKIRRHWRIIDDCTNEERSFIQYVEIMDKTGPKLVLPNGGLDFRDNRLNYRTSVDPHSCYATTALKELIVQDCSNTVIQSFSSSYTDPADEKKIIVTNGILPGTIKLPAIRGTYGVRCLLINITLKDGCNNRTDTTAQVCSIDDEAPEVLGTQNTVVTVDPATCWSRIYAKDLDRGSKDNCCNVLHFAIGRLDSIQSARKYVYDAIISQCGISDYNATKEYYDYYIEDYISTYIFKDYLDLGACSSYQIVLRAWEACGIPRYDPHIFPCSEHLWFLYNVGYPRSHYRADHNLNFGFSKNADYSKFKAPKDCNWRYPLIFCDPLLKDWFALSGLDDYHPAYAGAGAAELCDFNFYFPRLGLKSGSYYGDPTIPGNTCSRMLSKDVMVLVRVDDKTPPGAEKPLDLFWYCDNVSSVQSNRYEFAQCDDESSLEDNAIDLTCKDGNQNPYNEIECIKENDGLLTDTLDGSGKYFGWYGCNYYGGHPIDEHVSSAPCVPGEGTWVPIYCHSWLCLDKNDSPGKINVSSAFSKPVFRNSPPDNNHAGVGLFYIWDNCAINEKSLTQRDSSFSDPCGNGWIIRTWTAADQCSNTVSTSQKIVTRHRSDFEVVFPVDRISYCNAKDDLSPKVSGSPKVSDDECEQVGVTFTDEIFNITVDACYKIVRTWKVINWCKYEPNDHPIGQDVIVDDRLVADPLNRPCVYRNIKDNGDGYVSYVQIIKVIDSTAPEVVTRDTSFCITDNSCSGIVIDLLLNAFDECTSEDQLRYRWEIDQQPSVQDLSHKSYNKNSIDKQSGPGERKLHVNLPLGKSLVHVFVNDRCGNEDTSAFIVTIKDCKQPTPFCFNGIVTVLMPASRSITILAKDLDAGSYDNCTSKENLRYTFSTDLSFVNKTFTCTDIKDGKSEIFAQNIYVWDDAGLYDYCQTYLMIQDGSGNICPDSDSVNGDKLLPKFSKVANSKAFEYNIANGSEFLLFQNRPNPFKSSTLIQFNLPMEAVFDLSFAD
ncbi:MAG: glycine rich domain-containing protein, partial [Saprospiraceae bacterium]